MIAGLSERRGGTVPPSTHARKVLPFALTYNSMILFGDLLSPIPFSVLSAILKTI